MLARSRSHVEFASLVKTLAEHDPQDDNVLQRFEEAFARYHGVYRSFAMNQARAGLVVGLKALGIGPGDEILVQSFTFQGVVDAILNTGASAVLVNNSLEDLNSDTTDLERKISPRTKAIIATHLFGVPSDLSGIRTIAQRHEIPIIEDCAQCLGGTYEGKKVGTHGAMAICSFNYEKHLSTGEGGMLMVNTPELAQRTEEVLSSYRRMPLFNDACYAYGLLIMHIMTGSNLYRYGLSAYFGQNLCRTDPQFFATMERLVREEAPEAAFTAAVRSQVKRSGTIIGKLGRLLTTEGLTELYRYGLTRIQGPQIEQIDQQNIRMNTLRAAIGLQGLREVDAVNAVRNRNAGLLVEGLQDISSYTLPVLEGKKSPVYLKYNILSKEGTNNATLFQRAKLAGLELGNFQWPKPVHLKDQYRKISGPVRGDLGASEFIGSHIINIPVHYYVKPDQIQAILDLLKAHGKGSTPT